MTNSKNSAIDVSQKIKESARKGSDRLHLHRNSLPSLPESIGDLVELEILDLDRNELTSLPESIGNLGKLEELYIDHNKLTTLPESIGELGKLKELDLDNNKLTTLPESIGELKSLKKLYLEYNSFASLPGTLSKLSNLKEFYCLPIVNPDNFTTFNGKNRCFVRLDCGDFVAGCWRGNGKELIEKVKEVHNMSIKEWCPEVVPFL